MAAAQPRACLAMATDIARAGRYDEAEHCLAVEADWGPLRPAMLDLRGRILAQQGRYLEAEACWLEALRISPGSPTYREALDALRRRRGPLLGRWPVIGVAILALAAGSLIGFLGTGSAAEARHVEPLRAEIRAQGEEMVRQREELQRIHDILRTRLYRSGPAPADQRVRPKGQPVG